MMKNFTKKKQNNSSYKYYSMYLEPGARHATMDDIKAALKKSACFGNCLGGIPFYYCANGQLVSSKGSILRWRIASIYWFVYTAYGTSRLFLALWTGTLEISSAAKNITVVSILLAFCCTIGILVFHWRETVCWIHGSSCVIKDYDGKTLNLIYL